VTDRARAAAIVVALGVLSAAVSRGADGVAVGGYVDGLAVVGTEGGPRQRPGALGVLTADARLATPLRAHLELRGRLGGPFEGGHPGAYNFVHAFQNFSPSVELNEGYFTLHSRRADVDVGVRKFAWGKLDGVPPTDVVNPRDLHDPFVVDFEEAKIGVPALATTVFPPDVPRLDLSQLRLTLVYVPLAVPSRLPLLDERWFPQNALPPSSIVVRKEDVERRLDHFLARACRHENLTICHPAPDVIVDRDLVVPISVHTANHRPPLRLDAGGVGFRLAASWRDMDVDLYHYTGPETGADATVRVGIVSHRDPFPSSGGSPADPRTLDLQLRAASFLRQEHSTIHMTGADWSMVLGGAAIRAEAAFFDDRPYLRVASDLFSPAALRTVPISPTFIDQALRRGCSGHAPCRGQVGVGDLFPPLDSFEWGVGADYLIHGFFPLLQVNQIVLLESAPRLVINDPETRFTAVVRRRLMSERLELEARLVYALERHSWLAFPRVTYMVTDDLRVRLGYLAIGGERDHLIGQYRDNDEFVIQARYSF
jgi:hypothetical protein